MRFGDSFPGKYCADDDGMMSPSAPGIDHSNNNINKDNNEDEDDDVEDEERE